MTVGIEEENPLVRTTVEGGFGIEVMNLDTCCIGMEKGIVVDDMRHQCQFQQTSLLDFSYLETTNISKPNSRKVNGLAEVDCDRITSLNGTSQQTVETSILDGGFSLRNFKGIPLDPCLKNGQAVAATSEEFNPIIRSGVCSDQGIRRAMEDDHICIDDLSSHLGGLALTGRGPNSCFGVFDGHGGRDAAEFAREKLLDFIVGDVSFPSEVELALQHAFLKTDEAFAQACISDENLSSGTTAIVVLVLGRKLVVANAGDCRAVLSRSGKAVDLSRDHKPWSARERKRIEEVGGYVEDGYLNGQLGVARALGDWHMEGLKGEGGPLSAEPEIEEAVLSQGDEFLIIGCDGLWDVLSSQMAVDFARRRLQQHNDPDRCCRDLVAEALRRDSCDNLTVILVCFQPLPPPRFDSSSSSSSSSSSTSLLVRKSISSHGLRSLQSVLDNLLHT